MNKRPARLPPANKGQAPRHGIARVLSKLGICSRTRAADFVVAGHVRVNGKTIRDPEHPVDSVRDRIELNGEMLGAAKPIYLMLNKPRGVVTTAADERDRDTVYSLLQTARLPWIAPVGRLDKASEGLLLFTNDTAWAAALLEPKTAIDKTYHVQVTGLIDTVLLDRLRTGVDDAGEMLRVKDVRLLRQGEKNGWLEIVLNEGKNRHIRRLLAAFDIAVLRLIRVAVGPLQLGELAKGQWRFLKVDEINALNVASRS